jgi:hypothetical protein
LFYKNSTGINGYSLGRELVWHIKQEIDVGTIWVAVEKPTYTKTLKDVISLLNTFMQRVPYKDVVNLATVVNQVSSVYNPSGPTWELKVFNSATRYQLQEKKLQEFKDLQKFKEALEIANPTSIDSFLYSHEQFAEIGKFMIAYVLLNYENKNFHPAIDDWYASLYDNITSVCNPEDAINNNKLSLFKPSETQNSAEVKNEEEIS